MKIWFRFVFEKQHQRGVLWHKFDRARLFLWEGAQKNPKSPVTDEESHEYGYLTFFVNSGFLRQALCMFSDKGPLDASFESFPEEEVKSESCEESKKKYCSLKEKFSCKQERNARPKFIMYLFYH